MKQMKFVLYFMFMLILLYSLALGQPKLAIPEAEFDFGYVPQNSTISHIFWLYSTGTDSLKIINVRPG